MSKLIGPRRGPARLLSLLMSAAVCASTVVVAGAGPAAADIPPFIPCTSLNVGQVEPQIALDGTADYALWECEKSRTAPYVWYWQLSSIDNFEEQAQAYGRSASRFIGESLWDGLVQGGFGIFAASENHRAHLRYEGSFELWDWNRESTYRRDMGVHMVLKHQVGGVWSACGDTGWKNSPEPRARTSYTFYKLTSSCPGKLQLFVRAHFYRISTNSWWTSPWVAGKVHEPIGV